MSKPTGSLAEQIAALGLVKVASAASAKKKGASDFRFQSLRDPPVGDMEAEMAKNLAQSDTIAKVDSEGRRYRKRAKRSAPEFVVEKKKRPPSRAVEPARSNQKQASEPNALSGGLTSAAQERLRYEPEPPVSVEPPIKPVPMPQQAKIVPEPQPSPPEVPGETRPFTYAEAFKHITQIVGASTPAIEGRPTKIARKEALRLDEQVRRGAEWLRDNPDPDFDNGYVVGFDFGTSALKVVLRDPYVAGNPVAAMPAPAELCSQAHPYLWQTVIWFDPASSTFHPYPRPGAIALEGFKTGIVAGRGAEPVCEVPRITRVEAASAFIALHLCNLLGWYEKEKPLSRTRAKNFLGVNIGVPVATSDDPSALQPFKEVVRAAVELAANCEPLTLERVRAAVEMVHNEDLPAGFDLVPELSAALVGYASDPTSPWGAHVLIDVGASTLDIVAFNLVEHDGEPQIMAFAASVELLGAAALEIARGHDIADEDFLKASNQQFGDTYGYACREDIARTSFSKILRREDVQLVVTGGGCATSVHSQLIEALPDRILGAREIARPEPPRAIAERECDRARLLLAFGLAHDHPDIPAPTLPSRIPPIKPQTAAGVTYIGPEMT